MTCRIVSLLSKTQTLKFKTQLTISLSTAVKHNAMTDQPLKNRNKIDQIFESQPTDVTFDPLEVTCFLIGQLR